MSVHTKHCRHSILSDEDHINQRPELITIQVNSRRTTTNIIDGFIKTLEVYQVLVGPKALKVTRWQIACNQGKPFWQWSNTDLILLLVSLQFDTWLIVSLSFCNVKQTHETHCFPHFRTVISTTSRINGKTYLLEWNYCFLNPDKAKLLVMR